jgi:hypothetical protein
MDTIETRFNIIEELYEKVLKKIICIMPLSNKPCDGLNKIIINPINNKFFDDIEFRYIKEDEQSILKKIVINKPKSFISTNEGYYSTIIITKTITKATDKFDINKFIDDLSEEPITHILMEKIMLFFSNFDVINIFPSYTLPIKERRNVHGASINNINYLDDMNKFRRCDTYSYYFNIYNKGFRLKNFFSEISKNELIEIIQKISTDITKKNIYGIMFSMFSNDIRTLNNIHNKIALINDIYETLNEKYIKDDDYNNMIKIIPSNFYITLRNLTMNLQSLRLISNMTSFKIIESLHNYFMENIKTDVNDEYATLYYNFYCLMIKIISEIEEDK